MTSTKNDLQERVRRLQADIKELKTNQAVGGDSWLVYRTEINYTAQANQVNIITFVPDIDGPFVARAYWTTPARTTYGSDQDLTPDPNVNGKFYDCTYAASPVARTIMIYSTRKGKAYMTSTAGTLA